MEKDSIYELQIVALNSINFVYNDLKIHPQIKMTFHNSGESEKEKINNYLSMLTRSEKVAFREEIKEYLKYDAITESKMMLVVNYLCVLLVKSRNNQISIYNNSQLDQQLIEEFALNNAQIIKKIQTVRDKIFAHMDLDWMNYAKTIDYDEIEKCIAFLNGLFGINSEDFI